MWGLSLSSRVSDVCHPTFPALSTVSILQSRAVTGDITTRKNIEPIRSDIENDRTLGIRLKPVYDENKSPLIRSLIYQGNLFPELIMCHHPLSTESGDVISIISH
jgi:hypothetical protein